jgi:hypothetical protein
MIRDEYSHVRFQENRTVSSGFHYLMNIVLFS